jgi:hypothetical protein
MWVMGAREATQGVSLHELRDLIGTEVEARTSTGAIEGTLLSCTARSAWIVAGDVDHVVSMGSLLAIHPR